MNTLNTQTPERVIKAPADWVPNYDIHSMFFTFQGEGPFAGTPAVFVRLAGCNIQCPGCDTEYTQGRETLMIHEIVVKIENLFPKTYKSCLVVITGGEPFRQPIGPLINILTGDGYNVQVESNGLLAPPEDVDWKGDVQFGGIGRAYLVCSPKTPKVHPSVPAKACCFKYVIDHRSVAEEDGLPINVLGYDFKGTRVARPPLEFNRPIYIQPADVKDEELNELNLKTALASSYAFGYILQLQLHKIVGVE